MSKLVDIKDVQDYKYHPRLLELRVSGIYNNLIKEFGRQEADDYIKAMCTLFNLPYSLLVNVLRQHHKIQHDQFISAERKKQEQIFMGALWGESRYTIATKYMGLKSHNSIYQDPKKHNFKHYATPAWLAKLDDEVMVAGAENLKLVIINFLKAFETFVDLF